MPGGAVEAHGPWAVNRTCEDCGRPHGRPVVAGGPHLSVAHAGLLVAVAACAAVPVGVDVERLVRLADAAAAERWVEQEARLKVGGGGADAHVIQVESPLPGYAAALAVAAPPGTDLTLRARRWP